MSLGVILLIAIAAILVVLMIRVSFAGRQAARAASSHSHGDDGRTPAKTHSGHGSGHGCC
jgi:hypothetical protein